MSRAKPWVWTTQGTWANENQLTEIASWRLLWITLKHPIWRVRWERRGRRWGR